MALVAGFLPTFIMKFSFLGQIKFGSKFKPKSSGTLFGSAWQYKKSLT
jgi:hypothetical protein